MGGLEGRIEFNRGTARKRRVSYDAVGPHAYNTRRSPCCFHENTRGIEPHAYGRGPLFQHRMAEDGAVAVRVPSHRSDLRDRAFGG